jgi:hypothetical protein
VKRINVINIQGTLTQRQDIFYLNEDDPRSIHILSEHGLAILMYSSEKSDYVELITVLEPSIYAISTERQK